MNRLGAVRARSPPSGPIRPSRRGALVGAFRIRLGRRRALSRHAVVLQPRSDDEAYRAETSIVRAAGGQNRVVTETLREACEVVTFDWYATLAQPLVDGWWERIPQLVADAGGDFDGVAFAEWASMPTDHRVHSVSKGSYDAWCERRLRAFFRTCGVTESVLDGAVAASDAIRATERVVVFEQTIAALEELRRRGRTIALCSNWDWDLDRHLVANDVVRHVDLVVCSATAGIRKPNPAIFEIVTGALGVDASDVLFVGDDLDADVDGARAAGMRAVHAAWAWPCTADHDGDVGCCASWEELLALPELS